jgi:hypothetical protein
VFGSDYKLLFLNKPFDNGHVPFFNGNITEVQTYLHSVVLGSSLLLADGSAKPIDGPKRFPGASPSSWKRDEGQKFLWVHRSNTVTALDNFPVATKINISAHSDDYLLSQAVPVDMEKFLAAAQKADEMFSPEETSPELEAIISGGDSGGPLCTKTGELMGIVSKAFIPQKELQDLFTQYLTNGLNRAQKRNLEKLFKKIIKITNVFTRINPRRQREINDMINIFRTNHRIPNSIS